MREVIEIGRTVIVGPGFAGGVWLRVIDEEATVTAEVELHANDVDELVHALETKKGETK